LKAADLYTYKLTAVSNRGVESTPVTAGN
jgi:hypothetical protein